MGSTASGGWRGWLLAALLLLGALGQPLAAQPLPPEVEAALARAKVPRDALALLLLPAQGPDAARLSHRAEAAMNPASLMKLVTTYAALELLGPGYVWRTPVYAQGSIQGGTLHGNLYIRGQGDPKLVIERLWLLLRRVQAQGIRHIHGDIVLDHSAFEVAAADPASFDGAAQRPYNVSPDALLLNFKALLLTLQPDPASRSARVLVEPTLAGLSVTERVPLSGGGSDCGDYRSALQASLSDPNRIVLAGGYPSGCGEQVWPIAYADPASYAARLLAASWRELGGRLDGSVRDGSVPPGLIPIAESVSPPLAELVRDINKYSNNVMAQQLFLTLGLAEGQRSSSLAAARAAVLAWWGQRLGAGAPLLDNGSGLSRHERISAQSLAQLLRLAWASPLMPELLASLPAVGIDGTLRRSRSQASAHLKTGSLRDVVGIAGYLHASGGQRWVLVAIINHANAGAARPVLDALLDWAAREL